MNFEEENEWEIEIKATAWQWNEIRQARSAIPQIFIEDLWFARPRESANDTDNESDAVPEQSDSRESANSTENESDADSEQSDVRESANGTKTEAGLDLF